jgi:hypothetical protein
MSSRVRKKYIPFIIFFTDFTFIVSIKKEGKRAVSKWFKLFMSAEDEAKKLYCLPLGRRSSLA